MLYLFVLESDSRSRCELTCSHLKRSGSSFWQDAPPREFHGAPPRTSSVSRLKDHRCGVENADNYTTSQHFDIGRRLRIHRANARCGSRCLRTSGHDVYAPPRYPGLVSLSRGCCQSESLAASSRLRAVRAGKIVEWMIVPWGRVARLSSIRGRRRAINPGLLTGCGVTHTNFHRRQLSDAMPGRAAVTPSA